MDTVFSITHDHPPRDGLTISSKSVISAEPRITYFSLGRGTGISAETYEQSVLYIGSSGFASFRIGYDFRKADLHNGEALIIKPHTLCGTDTADSCVYTEIMSDKEFIMNSNVKAGEVFSIADLVPYENGSIVNMDVVSNDNTKFVVMAFDAGCTLEPHRAPGDALIFALEGNAVIGYEGKDYPIHTGENFRFEQNGLHSVKAGSRFKMALLLTLNNKN